MTALEKLRSAFADQLKRNVDPHEEFIFVGSQSSFMADGIAEALIVPPERESWQDDEQDEEPEYLSLFDVAAALDEIAELEKREPLPAPEPVANPADAYLALLAQWQDDRTKLAFYKEREAENRRILFAGAFPNPVEGTQRHKLPDGRTIKGQYKIGRKIDEAALPATLQHMRELGVANADVLVSYKPSLAKREWNTLSDDNKLAFSAAVIATPGMPTLDIEMPKKL